ncbi:DHH family phosphoesterase [Brachyspira hampsonii]|uniref:DHH family phosphoesterase n=1 Tax=Brachyspira hampsonii TaxID=1287055 RepID=UPI000D3BA077|nr:bifunctional oligoribonuclease/PAP phosphatase NrnA [Brachyspira hampsonii]PTY40267.1 phosphoesterase [Brachyspira hampsonii bv. II]
MSDNNKEDKQHNLTVSKKDIIERLSEADNVTITGHRNPDCDCICSGLALSLILKNIFNKNAYVVNTDKMQRDLHNVMFVDKVIFEVNENNLPKKDVLVVLDSGDIDRIGWIANILNEYNEVIFIDHHKVRNINGVTMFYDDTTAGATCEIIVDIFQDYLDKFDNSISTLLYCGICTDTGSFIFSNTTERTLLYGSKLMKVGIIQENLGNVVRKRYTKNDVAALMEIYRRMVIDYERKIGYICLEDTICGVNIKELAVSASDTLIQMEDVFIGFIIHENEDNFRVSIRSRCSKNIREVAESFGGGGHPKASGFSVSKKDYTKENLIKEINTKLIDLLAS